MRLQFWALGKAHESYVKEGVEMFTKRITNYYPVEWTIFPGPKNSAVLSEPDLKKKEGEIILNALQKDDFLVLLDERGIIVSSEGLANLLQSKADEGIKSMVFLIGGAFGVSDLVQKRANFKWSLSQLVFPHQLVRLILAEQAYRACSINRNEKYHHI